MKEKNGIEDILSKFLTEDIIKSVAEGMKAGLSEGATKADDSWCCTGPGKHVKNWIIIRIASYTNFSDAVAVHKTKLELFLKTLPEGYGVMFLPSNTTLEVMPSFGG